MRLIRSIDSPDLPDQGCVLTIGNFDAVHIGHQQILKKLVSRGAELDLPAVVMTFDPTPEEYFRKGDGSARLTSISSRFFLLRQCGVDVMLALGFNRALAETRAEDFIGETLFDKLKVKYLLIGDDFRFGAGRKGDYGMLARMAEQYDYEIDRFDTLNYGGRRVSSTYVRESLAEGNLEETEKLLGRKYAMSGRVLHGDKRGRQWGFPTLNLGVKRKSPMTGVFAVSVSGLGEDPVKGVANLGTRPTIGGLKTLLEVHLFDFARQVYGQRICVEFIGKIRDEQKFDSFDELKAQIFRDVQSAKTLLDV